MHRSFAPVLVEDHGAINVVLAHQGCGECRDVCGLRVSQKNSDCSLVSVASRICRPLVERGEMFAATSLEARKQIALLGAPMVDDGACYCTSCFRLPHGIGK